MFMDKIKLFCIPYAGGTAEIYRKYESFLHDNIEVVPLELRGRGKRFLESYSETLLDMSEELANKIIENGIEDRKYAIFGHSMGSYIALEIYYFLSKKTKKMPIHIFFSGNRAPHCSNKEKKIGHLSDKEFINEIYRMGGTPKDIFENKELSEIFLPILRADYKVLENYAFIEKDEKIKCPVTVLSGDSDNIDIDDLTMWQELVEDKIKFDIEMVIGDHFFIMSSVDKICTIINKSLVL